GSCAHGAHLHRRGLLRRAALAADVACRIPAAGHGVLHAELRAASDVRGRCHRGVEDEDEGDRRVQVAGSRSQVEGSDDLHLRPEISRHDRGAREALRRDDRRRVRRGIPDEAAAEAGRHHRRVRGPRALKIGITCYPTFGGSGVVATELGLALAKGGDDVHFISYALPSRLNLTHDRVHFHEVTVTTYPLFDPYPPYALALATKMAEVAAYEKLEVLHVHYAIPHAISAFLAKQILHGELKVVTTLHGTDITLVGRDESYLPITRFGIEASDGVTAVSQWLKDETTANFGTDKAIEVIPNFVDLERFHHERGNIFHLFDIVDEKLICHVSNFRPVKRIMDVLEVFERVARRIPSRLMMVGDGPDRSRAEA